MSPTPPVPGKLGNKCDPKGTFRCMSLFMALDGQDPADDTGLLYSLQPPYCVGVRFLDTVAQEGATKPRAPKLFRILTFKRCPFCGVKLPLGRV